MSEKSLQERIELKRKEQEQLSEKQKQLMEQIKLLERRQKEEERKRRTHMLVTLGAKISGLFSKSYLSEEEIEKVTSYLKECIEAQHRTAPSAATVNVNYGNE